MSSDESYMTSGGNHKPPTEEETKDLSSSKMVPGLAIDKVGGSFGFPPFQLMKEYSMPVVSPTLYEGCRVNTTYLKDLIFDQSNTAKIRPVLLSFGGLPDSGKTRAVSHLMTYVDESHLKPMTKIKDKLGAEGITYFELVAAGFHPLRNLTITEVTKESSCAFGILSAFTKKLLQKHKLPLFNLEGPLSTFEDHELEGHLQYIFSYICQYEHTPKGTMVTDKEQEYAAQLKELLPVGIALINIWDIAINRTVRHFMSALRGLLYNSHMWLFLDIDHDLERLDKPPDLNQESSNLTLARDWSVLMKWRPHLHYLVRSSRMSESKHGLREGVCTIFAKNKGTCNEDLKQNVEKLQSKVQQAAKHIGVSSLIEPRIETINFNGSDIPNDSSHRLYQKFQQLICQTPYEDIPLSWIFLRSLFFRYQKIFIAKSELKKKAKECGMDDASVTKFCEFYTSFGSIFDLSLVNPDYPYVIVKPMGFLESLDKLLYPKDIICQDYPTLVNGIIPGKALKEVFKEEENWSAFIEALLSINLATRVPCSYINIPDLDPNEVYYFISLCRKGDIITEADPTAVHLITSIDTPHVFKQALFAKHLLRSLQAPKLIPSSHLNQTIIKETSTGVTVTLVSYSPAIRISISPASYEVCSVIVKAYNEIAETYKIETIKYKFVMICAKSGVPDVRRIPSCQYHILPDDELCDECKNAGRINDQLKAWNKALNEHPIPSNCKPDEELKLSELAHIAEQIASCDPTVVAKTLGFQDLSQFQETEGERCILEMLLAWNRKKQSQVECRRELARKLLNMKYVYNGVPERKPDFETLAKELDIYAQHLKTQ